MAAPRVDVHRAAHRIEPGQQGTKPDVPVGDVLADDRGIETPSVVGDRQDDPVPFSFQPDADRRRPGMLADVDQQLARRPVQELLRLRLTDVLELGFDGYLGASLELLQQFSHRRRQAELGKDLRMQLGDGGT